MKLLNLRLKRFKRFSDFRCEFAPGINVVKGPRNEVGKSTLVEGLCTALLSNPRSTAKSLDDCTTWGGSERCETVIEFEENGACYRLEKDFQRKRIALINLTAGEIVGTPRQVEQAMESILGSTSERVFFATCCIRQGDVAGIGSGKEKISESLERVVTGGSEDVLVSRINRDLDRAISALTSTGAKNPGRIVRCQSEEERLRTDLTSARDKVEKVEKARLELVTIKQELLDVESSRKLKKELLEKNKQRQQIEQTVSTYKQEYQRLEETLEGAGKILEEMAEIERRRDEINQKSSGVPGFSDVQAVDEVRKKLTEIGINRESIRGDLQKRTEEIKAISAEMEGKRFAKALNSRFLLIAGLVLTLLGAIGTFFLVASIAGIVLGLLVVITHMWAKSLLSQLKTKHDGMRERISSMEKALEKLAIEEVENLGRVGCKSIDEFTTRDNEYKGLVKTKDELERKLEGCRNQLFGKIGNKRLEDIENESRDVRLKLRLEQDKLTEDLKSSALDGERYLALQSEVTTLEGKADELTDRMKRCTWTIESAEQTPEDITALDERLENLQETLAREQDKLRIYQLARNFINRARDETLRSAREILESEVRQNFGTFTCGKYTNVKLAGGELQFQIYSDEKADWVYTEELSDGTVDQFYLACRIALVRLLYGDSKPPLILDDPFVNFDSVRLQETLNYLKELARDYQILLLTLWDTYDEVADKVIVLGE
jgi:DNA repair exonuclease SbcCD ATPase subunit